MSQVADLLKNFPAINDGLFESRLRGVCFFKETKPIPRQPMVYDPGICIIAQGQKPDTWVARSFNMMPTMKLDVEQLASAARMSASVFHRAFKEITSDSPMQYLKKIRLTKAKDFIVQENMKAYIAADKVGYESSSQFSRDFKRYFGQSPAEMMQ